MFKIKYFSFRQDGVIRIADNVNIGQLWKSREGYMIQLHGERPQEVYVSREAAAGVLSMRYDKKQKVQLHIPVSELQIGDEFRGGPQVVSVTDFGSRIRVVTVNPINNYEFIDHVGRNETVNVSRSVLA